MVQSIQQTLKQTFNFDDFLNGQQRCIEQLLAGHSSLAIFPTGSGKSLCYQLTALHLPHLTVVVSPLLALIKDQVDFLRSKGIAAASIDSTLSHEQNQQVHHDIRSGQIKILMVSVERFKNERFREFIQTIDISMLVVDEAHCISEWGHNFRPDYLKLPQYRNDLGIPLVLLLTATATAEVKQDMSDKFNIQNSHIVQNGFYRNNLNLQILPTDSDSKDQRLFELIQKHTHNYSDQWGGIVYVTLQKSAEQLAELLVEQGLNAQAYHAGLSSETRQQIQHDFMINKTHIIVATIAFGMGIDKENVRFVIHYDLPKSIEGYSQEIGRAGRDNKSAHCITLANLDEIHILENFVYGDTPELSGIKKVLQNIKEETENSHWETMLLPLSNASNIRLLPLKTLLVQLELSGVLTAKFSYFADFKLRFIQAKQQILRQFDPDKQAFLNAVFNATQMKKIWGSLNFDTLFQNYNCERSRVVNALDYLDQKGLIELRTGKSTEVFQVDQNKLNDPLLAEQLYIYFQEKEINAISRIEQLVNFFQSEQCLSHTLASYFDDPDSPEHCQHCSVCDGHPAKLAITYKPAWPSDAEIEESVEELNHLLIEKTGSPPSITTSCRFLSGSPAPVFTRSKARQLNGYGLCSQHRYQEIMDKIKSLL